MAEFNFDMDGQGGGVVHDFFRNTYQPSPIQIQPTEALAQNIEALINPTEVLKQKQMESAVASVANLKLEGLRGKLYENAIKNYDAYLAEYQKELNANKGINRLKLTPEQQLKIGRSRQQLMKQVETSKFIQDDFVKAHQEAFQAVKEHRLTPEQLKKWTEEVDNLDPNTTDPGDINIPSMLLNKYVSPYSQKEIYALENTLGDQVPVATMGGMVNGKYTTVKGKNVADLTTVYSKAWDSDAGLQKMFPNKDEWVNKNVSVRARTSEIDKPPSVNINMPKSPFNVDFTPDETGIYRANISSYPVEYSVGGKKGTVSDIYYDDSGKLMMTLERNNPRAGRSRTEPPVLTEQVPYDPIVYKKWQVATGNVGTVSFLQNPPKREREIEKASTGDVLYNSSKAKGTFSRQDIIKNFVDSKGRIPTDKEWNDIVNQLGLKPKK